MDCTQQLVNIYNSCYLNSINYSILALGWVGSMLPISIFFEYHVNTSGEKYLIMILHPKAQIDQNFYELFIFYLFEININMPNGIVHFSLVCK